jgi:hypothetical protein
LNQQVDFGTILGYHSVAELKDLVAAKDADIRNLARRLTEVSEKLDLATFTPAYNTLITRYGNARAKAQKAIDDAVGAWRPLNLISAETEWNDLLSSLNPRWKEYTWSSNDGSIEDLYDKVIKAGSTGATDEPTPQPQSGSDIDFNALTATTHATQALEGAGKTISNLFDTEHLALYAILGGAFLILALPKLMLLSMPGGMLLRK